MPQNCSKIMRLYKDYENRQGLESREEDDLEGLKILYAIADKIGGVDYVKKAVASPVIKKYVTNKLASKVASKLVLGVGGPIGFGIGILSDVLEPTEISTGTSQYYDNLKNLLHSYYSGGKQKVQDFYVRLVDAQRMIEIEKDFGLNSNCYKTIDDITKAVKKKYVDSLDESIRKS